MSDVAFLYPDFDDDRVIGWGTWLSGEAARQLEHVRCFHDDGRSAFVGEQALEDRIIQRHQPDGEHILPRVHLVIALLKMAVGNASSG
jgi:hypothetical protein